jgi:murein DD-endopeptidase MepM/ murein hydrolase activator NlpD
MSAGTSTPVEAGQGPNVLGIAMSIGAKIRDAAQDAKEEREKAAEKGETPKKGSLFKSALANKFNPIKSKKAKSNWAKQFDWNKKTSDSPDTIKEPTTSDSKDGKAKLKEFIAGGFTAIIKDTSSMVSKLDGVKMLTGENLSEVTRASSSLTLIKESIDAQTDLRRKALEEARYARAEKQLEKTKDVAGVSSTNPVDKKDGEDGNGGGGGDGGGPFDWLLNALGIGDLVSNFIPDKWLQKLNPFSKPKVTTGGAPTGPRMPGTGPRITTSGGAAAPRIPGGNWWSKMNPFSNAASLETGLETGIGASSRLGGIGRGLLGAGRFGLNFLSRANLPLLGAMTWGDTSGQETGAEAFLQKYGAREGERYAPGDLNPDGSPKPGARPQFSEGGMVPNAVPLARGGIVDNPTKTNLNPGDSVIPLNRNIGKQILGDTNQTTPGETALDTVGAMILGVSAGMLGKTESGSVGDQVKQDIRKASKQFGISNLTFTSSIGRGQFGKVDMNKDAKGFLMSLFKNIKIGGGKGKEKGGGGNPPPNGEVGPGMTATGGEKASSYITSRFGKRNTGIPGASTDHGGIDVSGGSWQQGAPISVIKPGVVEVVGDHGNESWGKHVVIKHDDGTYSLYGHLDSVNVKKGDKIENKAGAATVIGKVGSTGVSSGAHLHFELGRGWNGTITDKMDPAPYVDNYVRAGGKVTVSGDAPTPRPVEISQGITSSGAASQMPDANMTQLPIAQDGMIGPSWMPWNWGKLVDKHRSAKSTDYANPNSMLAQAARQREMMKELGYASGGTGGDKQSVMHRNAARLTAQRATQQRALLGVVRSGGKNGKFTVTNTGMRPGESEEDWGQRTSQATRLANRLNKEQGLNKPKPTPPRPTPGKSSSSSSGTRPAPRQTASPTAVAAVMPPKPVQQSTASAEGSFGSSVPAGKTSAMVFADFLYYDLV